MTDQSIDTPGLTGLDRQRQVLRGERPGPGIWRLLGLALESIDEGRATLTGTPAEEANNSNGSVHGGWYGTLLDSCMACAVATRLPADTGYTTLEYKVNIIRAVPVGTTVRAIGTTQHVGRSTAIALGEIRGIGDDRLYATATTTCMILGAAR